MNNFTLLFHLGKIIKDIFPLRFLGRNIDDGILTLKYDHINIDNEYPLSESLDNLWKCISGHNSASLINLIPFYFLIDNQFFIRNNYDKWDEYARKGIFYYYIPFFDVKEVILNMVITFSIKGLDKEIQVNFNVPEFLLFKSNLTNLRRKHFIKFVHKCFKENNMNIDEVYFTEITVKYIFRAGKTRS